MLYKETTEIEVHLEREEKMSSVEVETLGDHQEAKLERILDKDLSLEALID